MNATAMSSISSGIFVENFFLRKIGIVVVIRIAIEVKRTSQFWL